MILCLLPVDSNFNNPTVYLSVNFDESKTIEDLTIFAKDQDLDIKHNSKVQVWKAKVHMNITSTLTKLKDTRAKENFEKDFEELFPDQVVENLGLSAHHILLLRVLGMSLIFTALRNKQSQDAHIGTKRKSDERSVDGVQPLREFKLYKRTLETPGPSPSQGAKSTGYHAIQSDNAQVIYDGRWARDGIGSTIGPPIQLFHPIFNEFINLVNAPDTKPTTKDLKNVYELMDYVSEVGWPGKDGYSEGLQAHLTNILGFMIHEEINPDGFRTDNAITLQIGTTRIMTLIMEVKRELGEGCDPSTQVSLSMRRSWIDSQKNAIREKCCCPTFLIAAGGPWLSILGGIFTDKVIVQRLTDMKWMALSSIEEYSRVYHHAKLFLALRKCLLSLTQFYMDLSHTPPFVDNQPHPRYFPYPTSFTSEGGETTYFRYLESLQEHAACVTYLAEEIPKEPSATAVPRKMVVKFVARYGDKVHRFLACNGHAPALRYCGPLPNTRLSGAFPEPAQGISSDLQLRSDIMQMVVMDYIEASNTRDKNQIPHDARQQIWTILELLHEAGYVFGDLRSQNILFDAEDKAKLIDFNWCGRYPRDNTQNQINDGGDGHEDYARYPLSMSMVEGMWAKGMEPLGHILPDHDRRMFEKLPYP